MNFDVFLLQNSAARKKTIVEFEDAKMTSTLIQIGAIAKEMQFDKLNHWKITQLFIWFVPFFICQTLNTHFDKT